MANLRARVEYPTFLTDWIDARMSVNKTARN